MKKLLAILLCALMLMVSIAPAASALSASVTTNGGEIVFETVFDTADITGATHIKFDYVIETTVSQGPGWAKQAFGLFDADGKFIESYYSWPSGSLLIPSDLTVDLEGIARGTAVWTLPTVDASKFDFSKVCEFDGYLAANREHELTITNLRAVKGDGTEILLSADCSQAAKEDQVSLYSEGEGSKPETPSDTTKNDETEPAEDVTTDDTSAVEDTSAPAEDDSGCGSVIAGGVHRWELGGKLLSAANSDIYYGAPTDADLAFTADNTALKTSEAFEFNAIDLAKYPNLKVNFTPINTSEGANGKIVEGPFMVNFYYTLTSSNGTSVTIDSTKKAVGDLNGSQMETIAISGLDDVVSITVTVGGNRELCAYYFNFSFVNGEGVEKATVTASQNILMVGHQRSTEITNNKMGLRFVAAVENIEGYTEIGFDVASTGKETASVSGKSVYTSVLGEDRTYYALDNFVYTYLFGL